MKLSKRRKVILLVTGVLILIFAGFREEWHSLFWFGIDIGYDYCIVVREKMRIIVAIFVIGYILFVMVKDD